jgi:hypothetical protein
MKDYAKYTRVLVHIVAIAAGVVVLPLLTIEHETVGLDHVLRIDCYLFRATSNYISGKSCVALIDKINHDNSVPYLIVGEDAAVIGAEVYALAIVTICLHLVGALVLPVAAMIEDRFGRTSRHARSWARFATCASVVIGGWTLDTAQRWSREHDAATPDMSATYASLGGGTYLIVGLPLVSTIILASQQR